MSDLAIIAYKNLGETPLEALERVRKERNINQSVPMTYAGRLDPMAEGVLILLLGDECKNKDAYLGLDKTYEFEILVGFSTDTYDLLGLVTFAKSAGKNSASGEPLRGPEFLPADEANMIQSFIGTFIQKYPSYSSKTVGGKQLFELSREDNLPDQMPEHEVTIYKLSCTSTMVSSKKEVENEIVKRIGLVKGDFRQEEIIKKWKEEFEKTDQKEFEILKFTCKCSSGTYIRQLVADMGEKIGIPLVTYSIKRTQLGEYSL